MEPCPHPQDSIFMTDDGGLQCALCDQLWTLAPEPSTQTADIHGMIRCVATLDEITVLDEAFPNPNALTSTVGKAFEMEGNDGSRSRVEILFHFDPPLRQA
jgi:hypothetical protein